MYSYPWLPTNTLTVLAGMPFQKVGLSPEMKTSQINYSSVRFSGGF